MGVICTHYKSGCLIWAIALVEPLKGKNVEDSRDGRLLRFEAETGEDGVVSTEMAAQLLLAEIDLSKFERVMAFLLLCTHFAQPKFLLSSVQNLLYSVYVSTLYNFFV